MCPSLFYEDLDDDQRISYCFYIYIAALVKAGASFYESAKKFNVKLTCTNFLI